MGLISNNERRVRENCRSPYPYVTVCDSPRPVHSHPRVTPRVVSGAYRGLGVTLSVIADCVALPSLPASAGLRFSVCLVWPVSRYFSAGEHTPLCQCFKKAGLLSPAAPHGSTVGADAGSGWCRFLSLPWPPLRGPGPAAGPRSVFGKTKTLVYRREPPSGFTTTGAR